MLIILIITYPDKLEIIVLQALLMSGDFVANALSRISVKPSVSWSVRNNAVDCSRMIPSQ